MMEKFAMNKLKLYTDDDYRENVLKNTNLNKTKEVNKNGRNR